MEDTTQALAQRFDATSGCCGVASGGGERRGIGGHNAPYGIYVWRGFAVERGCWATDDSTWNGGRECGYGVDSAADWGVAGRGELATWGAHPLDERHSRAMLSMWSIDLGGIY